MGLMTMRVNCASAHTAQIQSAIIVIWVMIYAVSGVKTRMTMSDNKKIDFKKLMKSPMVKDPYPALPEEQAGKLAHIMQSVENAKVEVQDKNFQSLEALNQHWERVMQRMVEDVGASLAVYDDKWGRELMESETIKDIHAEAQGRLDAMARKFEVVQDNNQKAADTIRQLMGEIEMLKAKVAELEGE